MEMQKIMSMIQTCTPIYTNSKLDIFNYSLYSYKIYVLLSARFSFGEGRKVAVN